jgi:transcription elongation factor Elf1
MKNKKLIETKFECMNCGKLASFVLSIKFKPSIIDVNIPLCSSCVKANPQIEIKSLPSHEPLTLSRANSFPPKSWEWFKAVDDNMSIGCPKCDKLVGLNSHFKINEKSRLEPSFICPHCGLHAWLNLI